MIIYLIILGFMSLFCAKTEHSGVFCRREILFTEKKYEMTLIIYKVIPVVEFDMVVYDRRKLCCDIYEVKYSKKNSSRTISASDR